MQRTYIASQYFPMTISGKVVLRKGREASAKRFHPWIFSGAVQSTEGTLNNGDWVEAADAAGKTLGYGHYQKGTITVRLLSFGGLPDERFYPGRLMDAWQQRKTTRVIQNDTNCYRLVHGEGDGLSGLVIDCYDGVAVMQAHSPGMHVDRYRIAAALKQVMGDSLSCVYYKSQHQDAPSEYLMGACELPHTVLEHGRKFYVDWAEGQKTGFFLDQRENRKLLADFSSGARVLNTFCYTGGFSVYALTAGASMVCSVDSSTKAIALTEKNLTLNGFDPQRNPCLAVDTFDYFKPMPDRQEGSESPFDVIILDPPAFAKHKDARHQAMRGYQRLNAEAMRVARPGSLLFTFSCSQVVDRQLFYDTVVSSAIQAGREIQVLNRLSQPADHPVSMFHPEGEYLKGLVLHIR
jgi:23S rRNA (cytosine1962-C5)-methyltransferase